MNHCFFRILLISLIYISKAAGAEATWFTDVTDAAGIRNTGATYGASWGDLNGDGLPDLWVGNHYRHPSLYINQRDGTFLDQASTLWNGNSEADTHGAAWGDIDNDGDQDLIEVVGAAQGRGQGPNHLYINEKGRLVDRAESMGADDPFGRGRNPIWFDVNNDGLLDLILTNASRKDGRGRDIVLTQRNGEFNESKLETNIVRVRLTRKEKVRRLWQNILSGRFRLPTRVYGATKFATAANVYGDQHLELLLFAPLQILTTTGHELVDITDRLEIPRIQVVTDAAIADFDGDGDMDIFLTTPESHASEVLETGPNGLKARLMKPKSQEFDPELNFKSQGRVTYEFSPEWAVSPENIKVGTRTQELDSLTFTVSQQDSEIALTSATVDQQVDHKVHVFFDRNANHWVVRSRLWGVSLEVTASEEIEITNPLDHLLKPSLAHGLILLKNGNAFEAQQFENVASSSQPCGSVVAADFDNDLDTDIYLVCSGLVKNGTNQLYENDGKGHFTLVTNSGADGSIQGIGDTAVTADFDGDGFLDLFVANGYGAPPFWEDGPHQLLRNNGNDNNWLQIDLVGTKSNRDGIGARAEVYVGDNLLVREQNGGMHLRSQDHMRLHFGLGEHRAVDRIVIHWPSGMIEECDKIAANQLLTLEEGAVSASCSRSDLT